MLKYLKKCLSSVKTLYNNRSIILNTTAIQILRRKFYMKKFLALIMVLALCVAFTACTTGGTSEAPASSTDTPAASSEAPVDTESKDDSNGQLVVGFAQVGAESGWRDAETQSIKDEAAARGIDLKFADGQGEQANQIKAIRTFIQQKVDVIGLAPVVDTGWDAVLKEAKDAGIPVILLDRGVTVADESLYASFIGSDFIQEGKDAAIELSKLMDGKGNVVILEGTVGASAATDRQTGFKDEIEANHKDITILESQTADFTRDTGKQVMETFLKSHSDIGGLYAHNDDMALGAIEAIKAEGKKPGEDIKIVSVDGVKAAFEAMVAGELNVTVECNPLLGPQFYDACQILKDGGTVEKWIKSDEGIYRQETAAEDIKNRQY